MMHNIDIQRVRGKEMILLIRLDELPDEDG